MESEKKRPVRCGYCGGMIQREGGREGGREEGREGGRKGGRGGGREGGRERVKKERRDD